MTISVPATATPGTYFLSTYCSMPNWIDPSRTIENLAYLPYTVTVLP